MQAPPPIVPTAEQIAICQSTHPRLLVEDNAGTAKTTTAALKIAHLVAHGVNPSRVVALSFSRPGVQAFHDAFRRIGMDADFALVDLGLTRRVVAAELGSYSDYSLYDGWELTGWPVATILRGTPVMQRGRIVGPPGLGRYLERR